MPEMRAGRKLKSATAYRARPGRKSGGRGRPTRKSKKPTQTKKAFVKQRQAVVETKSRTHEEIAENPPPGTDMTLSINQHKYIFNPTDYKPIDNRVAYTFFHPTSFLSMNQGMDEDELNGLTCFVKAVKTKISILMPHGGDAITNPFNLYLIHGDVVQTNFTGNTIPQAPIASRPDIRNHIENRVVDYFDERKDKLRFISKSGVTVNIKGYERVLNNKNTSWLADLGSAQAPYNKSITWRPNKKVKYEKGFPAAGDPTANPSKHQVHLYPNYTRLPFIMLFSPQHASLDQSAPGGTSDNKLIRVAYNDCTWFTDS